MSKSEKRHDRHQPVMRVDSTIIWAQIDWGQAKKAVAQLQAYRLCLHFLLIFILAFNFFALTFYISFNYAPYNLNPFRDAGTIFMNRHHRCPGYYCPRSTFLGKILTVYLHVVKHSAYESLTTIKERLYTWPGFLSAQNTRCYRRSPAWDQ